MMDKRPRIVRKPDILSGKPIIEGTRISVDLILEWFEAGMTVDEILANYPHLTRSQLEAAVAYARRVVAQKPVRTGRS